MRLHLYKNKLQIMKKRYDNLKEVNRGNILIRGSNNMLKALGTDRYSVEEY